MMRDFSPGDVIQMPHYQTAGGPIRTRAWKITGVHLGGENQEGTYQMIPLDYCENQPIHVPCVMLDQHPLVKRV